jgi:hypothetical protein
MFHGYLELTAGGPYCAQVVEFHLNRGEILDVMSSDVPFSRFWGNGESARYLLVASE